MPKTVDVPIPTSCVKSVPKPPEDCFSNLPSGFELDAATACLLKFRDESLAYQARADALFNACKNIGR